MSDLEFIALELKARRARKVPAPSIEAEFYRLSWPTVRRVARGFVVRGALETADLEQVAFLEGLKALDRYEPGPGYCFGHALFFAAKRACFEQVRLKGSAVRLTRAMRRDGCPAPRFVEFADDTRHDETPEALLERAQTLQNVLYALSTLTPEQREVIRRFFALGCRAASVRDLCASGLGSRPRVLWVRERALAALRLEARKRGLS